MTDGLFVVLIVAVIIDAGAHLVHELRQRHRDALHHALVRDVRRAVRMLDAWRVTWPDARVKAALDEAVRDEPPPDV